MLDGKNLETQVPKLLAMHRGLISELSRFFPSNITMQLPSRGLVRLWFLNGYFFVMPFLPMCSDVITALAYIVHTHI